MPVYKVTVFKISVTVYPVSKGQLSDFMDRHYQNVLVKKSMKNMQITKLFIALIITAFTLQVNGQGIDFKHISYEEALSKAKEQNKLIFVDFYTQWCGPCKKLAKGPFLEKEVGDFYNANFISLKLDAEHEGLQAARDHNVISYPTLLFIDGQGNMVFKGYGRDVEGLIESAKEAINSVEGEYTLEKLNEQFVTRQDDEAFLKMYLSKIAEYGVNPSQGIEAWLKVQTEMPENSTQMRDYLLSKRNDLLIGGKGESILLSNVDAWLKNADKMQARLLSSMHKSMLNNTRRYAYRLNDPDLLQAYINVVSELPDDNRMKKDLHIHQVKCYLMKKDYDACKQYAEHVVDSIIKSTDVKAIHQKDAERYNSVKSSYESQGTEHALNMLERYRLGSDACDVVNAIERIGQDYLKAADCKSNFKTLNNWIKYCYKLVPDYYLVDNWKANTLYKSGRQEKAIELKQTAIEKYPSNTKKLVNRKIELEQMVKGEEVFVEE